MKPNKVYLIIICIIVGINSIYGVKLTKIKLTGTLNEPTTLIIGETGRIETINSLPYVLEVKKDELPLKLQFKSPNYIFYDIDVPKKPFDTTGHVYLVKINETAMSMMRTNNGYDNFAQNNYPSSKDNTTVIQDKEYLDTSIGVNAAPLTGAKNEKTLALIITNEEYELAANVENATLDGLAFKEYCLKTFGVPKDNIRHITNLSYGRMRKALNDMLDLADMLNGEATLLIYYAGHGIPDNKTKDAFLMPIDADGTDTNVCLSLDELYSNINSKNLNKCIIFLDACFSGAQRGGEMVVSARGVKLKPKETIPQGKTIVFSATSGEEAAFSHKEERHGLFTYYLLKKLQETKGKISLGDLADYLSEKVGFESRRINQSPQTPTVSVSPAFEDNWKKQYLIK